MYYSEGQKSEKYEYFYSLYNMTNKMSLCLKKLKVYTSAKLNVVKANTCILVTVNKELTHCFKEASLETEERKETH